jgi:ribose 5-phosphate isomerase B
LKSYRESSSGPAFNITKGEFLKIVVAADHGGYELKTKIIKWLEEMGHNVDDAGNKNYDPKDDYPDFAIKAAEKISRREAEKGIIVCGSGVGACITANKIKGVRASICHDIYSAHQGVEHDDMNVLCLGARIIGENLAKELVQAFVKAKYVSEERFERRLNKIKLLEE